MAVKKIEVEGIGSVKIYKRRGTSNMRLRVGVDGEVKLTMPYWLSQHAGLAFIKSKRQWISSQLPKISAGFGHGMSIGKSYQLSLIGEQIDKPRSKVTDTEVQVRYPQQLSAQDQLVQSAIQKAIIRALRNDAESLLPARLAELGQAHNFNYRSVQVKQLKARWGSCSNQGDIALSLFLMQLPWHLIDYVLVHELTHTKHFGHGSDFWNAMYAHTPNAKALKKEIRNYRPSLIVM